MAISMKHLVKKLIISRLSPIFPRFRNGRFPLTFSVRLSYFFCFIGHAIDRPNGESNIKRSTYFTSLHLLCLPIFKKSQRLSSFPMFAKTISNVVGVTLPKDESGWNWFTWSEELWRYPSSTDKREPKWTWLPNGWTGEIEGESCTAIFAFLLRTLCFFHSPFTPLAARAIESLRRPTTLFKSYWSSFSLHTAIVLPQFEKMKKEKKRKLLEKTFYEGRFAFCHWRILLFRLFFQSEWGMLRSPGR